jgi:beta-phosphoglucomutase-like phosphatase (HAD superfamily)
MRSAAAIVPSRRTLTESPPWESPARQSLQSRVAAPPIGPPELDTVAARWQTAFDSAQRALAAAGGRFGLSASELRQRRNALGEERRRTANLLLRLASETHAPEPWLSPVALTPRMLGLHARIAACVFDLDDVLTNSATLHAEAWAEVFDAYLATLAAATGRQVKPFDTRTEYFAYVDGRPRIEAVHVFLESRGVHLAEGRPADPASSNTAYGLACRKDAALSRAVLRRGVSAVPGARRYLQACGYAGLKRGVVSASANMESMLELAHLSALVDARVDATTMKRESLRARPSPDVIVAACRRLGVVREEVVSFTHSPAGIAAARAAGVAVIGVGEGAHAELLHAYGAERVVPSLGRLIGSI